MNNSYKANCKMKIHFKMNKYSVLLHFYLNKTRNKKNKVKN